MAEVDILITGHTHKNNLAEARNSPAQLGALIAALQDSLALAWSCEAGAAPRSSPCSRACRCSLCSVNGKFFVNPGSITGA